MTETPLLPKVMTPLHLQSKDLLQKANELIVEKVDDIENANKTIKECTALEKVIEEERTNLVKPMNDAVKQINNMAKEVSIPVGEAKTIIKQKILSYNEKVEKKRKEEEIRINGIISEISMKTTKETIFVYVSGLSIEDQNNFLIKTTIEKQVMKLEEIKRREAEDKKRKEEDERLKEQAKLQSEEQAKIEKEKLDIERQKREVEAEKKRMADEKALAEKQKIADKIKNTEVDNGVKGLKKVVKYEIINEYSVPKQFCSPDSKKINEALKNGLREIDGIRIWEETTIGNTGK